MAIVDHNLREAIAALTNTERRAVEDVIEDAGSQPQSEALRALRCEAIRKVKARLKRRARRKRDARAGFKWMG